jgi:glycerate dehydrogenase
MRIVLLDSFAADQGAPWPGLERLGEVVAHPRTDPSLVVERCAGAEAIVTNKVVLSKDTIDALPDLRYIGLASTGTNVVDLLAARARGIAVTNVPAYSTESVANLVFAMVLHFSFAVAAHDRAVKAGRWASHPDFCFFLGPLHELAGKTLVIVGMGAIGKAVARIGSAFGMNVVAAEVPGSTRAGRVPLLDALPLADVVTLHCPLVPSTQGLVNARFLGALKASAILINTSRGALVEEADLVEALRAGKLGGVGLDVMVKEPPPATHPLADPAAPWADRLVITPHLGWGTVEARQRLASQVAENLAAFQEGQRLNRVD